MVRHPLRGPGRSWAIWLLSKCRQHHALDRRFCSRETQGFTWRTLAVSIPLTDLVPGTNAVTIGADQTVVTSNVDIVLVNAGALRPSAPTHLHIVGLLVEGLVPTCLTEGSRAIGSTRAMGAPTFIALVVYLVASGALLWPARGRAASASCGLANGAFCDTFDEGPAAIRGRGGDLDPAKWSAARLAP